MSISGIYPDWPAPKNVNAWSSCRKGGYSNKPFDEMNLALHVNDDENSVCRNRKLLCESLKLPTQPCWLNQTHSVNVVNAILEQQNEQADGSYTTQSGIVCVVMTADCLPILLCDKKGSVVAAVHAGWRGLLNGIIHIAIEKLKKPNDQILAWLGPAIGPQSFQVGDEVRDAFLQKNRNTKNAFLPKSTIKSDGFWLANLYRLAELQLQQLGINQVYGQQWCTYKEDALFYSYRRDGVTGRMASLIWLS